MPEKEAASAIHISLKTKDFKTPDLISETSPAANEKNLL